MDGFGDAAMKASTTEKMSMHSDTLNVIVLVVNCWVFFFSGVIGYLIHAARHAHGSPPSTAMQRVCRSNVMLQVQLRNRKQYQLSLHSADCRSVFPHASWVVISQLARLD